MNSNMYITRHDVEEIGRARQSDNAIIFLSGPTSVKTPLPLLKENDVIAVNGSATWLINNGVKPFIYVLTDGRFINHRAEDFDFYVKNSQFVIINCEVYDDAPVEKKQWLRENCLILKKVYNREKAGPLKKIKYGLLSLFNKNIVMHVPWSRRKRLVGFSRDVSAGYCSCHTVAWAAIQIAYSLHYKKIVCSGLDLTDNCARFHDDGSRENMPSELQNDLWKILPFFEFMRKKIDINIYNLSDNTSIPYSFIPFITPGELQLR